MSESGTVVQRGRFGASMRRDAWWFELIATGRVVKRGNNLNIIIELIDVRNNKSLWGEQYERQV